MTSQKPNYRLMRYSPRPLADYVSKGTRVAYGPATSSLLTTPANWNLAYISFDFEAALMHPDPNFTTHVRSSCMTRLIGGELDLAGKYANWQLVGSLLEMPAPQFVNVFSKHPVLPSLPLYQAYGEDWLDTITKRSRLCQADHVPDDDVRDVSQAMQALAKFL